MRPLIIDVCSKTSYGLHIGLWSHQSSAQNRFVPQCFPDVSRSLQVFMILIRQKWIESSRNSIAPPYSRSGNEHDTLLVISMHCINSNQLEIITSKRLTRIRRSLAIKCQFYVVDLIEVISQQYPSTWVVHFGGVCVLKQSSLNMIRLMAYFTILAST